MDPRFSIERFRAALALASPDALVPATPRAERPSRPARERHTALRGRLAAIEGLAEGLAAGATAEGVAVLADIVHFFDSELSPHMAAEEAILYDLADRLAGLRAPLRYTDVLRHQHAAIAARTDDLRSIAQHAPRHWPRASAIAIALVGLARAHFDAEEDIVFELLDSRMTSEQFAHDIGEPTARWLEDREAHARSAR